MRKILLASVFILTACTPDPTVVVRIDCGEHNNQELQVELNGKPSGTCPMDMMIHAGDLTVTARKYNEDASYLYGEAKMMLAENAMKRIKLDIQPVYTEEYYYRKATNLEGMQQYIELFPDGKYKNEVVDKIEQYYFDKTTDLAGMRQYFEKLSDGRRRKDVVDKIDQYYFDKATDLAGMRQYLEEVPDGRYKSDVATKLTAEQSRLKKERINREFLLEEDLYKKAIDIPSMEAYLEKQPNGKRKAEIQQRLTKERANPENFAPGLVMVNIPAGSFQMGDLNGTGDTNEKPVHKVTLKSFAMSKHEVTFAQYDVFAKATKRELPDDEGWGRGKHPVINVSWKDATAYATWLSQQTGKRFRLPSEAEWEYAARAGTTTNYSWGNNIDCENARYGNRVRNSSTLVCTSPSTVVVGSYESNSFGLHDMHGNVDEWVADVYRGTYEGAPSDGRAVPSRWKYDDYVVRGGSRFSTPWGLRSSWRDRHPPTNLYEDVGFRLAQDI